MEESMAIAQIQMVRLGQRMAGLFEQRVQPGMSSQDVVRVVAQISAETDGFIPSGEPQKRTFEMVNGLRVDTWEYSFDGSLAQNNLSMVYLLTFQNGAVTAMRPKG